MTIAEILTGEKDNTEYKVDIPSKSENYMRTVVAYANANGGRLVFGVENNTWKVTGFSKEEVFQKMDAVTNAIYDSCEPKITPNIEVQEFDGRYIIVVDVPAGMQRPYCIKSQGVIEGVYLRVSGTTRKAAIYQIQEMTLSARNRSYDTEKTSRELTTDEIQAFCNRLYQHARELCVNEEAKSAIRQISISQLLSFRLVHEENGRYYAANGYQLLDGRLEDYPDAAIQCAVFKGTTRNIFITRKEFSGYIDEQVESAYAFVLEHINLGARIDGLARQDIYELPIRTIREMITNAVCHRSYLCPGKVQIALFDDRLEVTSPGMLDKDLTIEKMKAGISKIRNTAIARVFAYMNMIEAWGTGIPKIFQEAKDYGLREPELLDMGSDFRINLYRGTPMVDRYGVINPKSLTRQADD
ncbi:MAG: ATP-binding protein [Lachnospiraceae bacterium]|nr:ATP-binding protein [Lachnospiraceae bacterium]